MSEDFDVKRRTEIIYERWRSENNKKLSDMHPKEDGELLFITETVFEPWKVERTDRRLSHVKCFIRKPIENQELIKRVHQIITAS